MGLKRLRGRLDQLQGHANGTLAGIDALVEELRDGFTIEVDIAPEAGKALIAILSGQGGKLPVRVRIVPEED